MVDLCEAALRKLFAPRRLRNECHDKAIGSTIACQFARKLRAQSTEHPGGGFLDAVKQALATTSQLQSESGRLGREVAFGSPTVSLEETMLAGVKSNIAFQATLQSRNRIVQAYTDVMNMQV